jgi:hypothetical protein
MACMHFNAKLPSAFSIAALPLYESIIMRSDAVATMGEWLSWFAVRKREVFADKLVLNRVGSVKGDTALLNRP